MNNFLSRLRFYVGTELHRRRYRNFRTVCSSDAMVSGFSDRVASLRVLLDRGKMDLFCKRFNELMVKLAAEPLMGKGLFLPELDELAQRASSIFGTSTGTRSTKLLVYVATTVYLTGGHTRVIEDMVTALPEYRHLLILTCIGNEGSISEALRSRFNALGLDVQVLKETTTIPKVRELVSRINALGPEAVFLFTHPDDLVASLAVSPHSVDRVIYVHHSDHRPSLGSFRTDYVHVDVTPGCHQVCASIRRLHASFLNLTIKDHGTVSLSARPRILGATCGSPHKYVGCREFTYGQLLGALFEAGVDRVLHIGEMPLVQQEAIRKDIINSDDAERIVFLPNVDSLAHQLIQTSPDFYLTSHPIGGGKATLEAMSVGLPVLYVCPRSSPLLLNSDMTFGASIPVQSIEKISAAIQRLKKEKWTLGKQSRAVYEEHYSPAAFREGLLRTISTEATARYTSV